MSEFKVGDWVVFIDEVKFKSKLLKVVHIELGKVLDIDSESHGYIDFDNVRYATHEEIKAGRRLL